MLESRTIVQASYNYGEDDEEFDFEIYYLLLEGDGELFAVDVTDGTITLREMLDREEVDYYQLKIIASNSESLPTSYDEQSVLVVEIEVEKNKNVGNEYKKKPILLLQVLDVNDNPPNFSRRYYSNGISTTTALESTIITLSVNKKLI